MGERLGGDASLMMNQVSSLRPEFGLDLSEPKSSPVDEIARLTLENEQLKIDRNQLQKQLNTALKKKPFDYVGINTSSNEGKTERENSFSYGFTFRRHDGYLLDWRDRKQHIHQSRKRRPIRRNKRD